MKNIIVTGGFGLIGYNLIKKLNKKYNNCKILICDAGLKNPFPFLKDDLYEKLNNYEEIPGLDDLKEYYVCCSLSKHNIQYFFGTENIDYVFHLGAIADPTLFTFENGEFIWEWNIQSTKRLIDVLNSIKNEVYNFFFASTSEVYGFLPKGEKATEKTPLYLNPLEGREIYAIGKLLGENLVLNTLHNAYRKIVGRIFNTYGFSFYEDNRLIQNLLKWAYLEDYDFYLNNPDAIRSFCYVDDLVNEIISILDYDENYLNEKLIVNLGNPKECYTIKDVVEIFKKVFNVNKKYFIRDKKIVEPAYREFELSTFEYYCDYKPNITLEEGLRRLKIEYDKYI